MTMQALLLPPAATRGAPRLWLGEATGMKPALPFSPNISSSTRDLQSRGLSRNPAGYVGLVGSL